MTQMKPAEENDTVSVSAMKQALADEIRDVMKDAQLRIQEFSQLVAAYAAGEITPEQATDKFCQYKDKWGDPLPGVTRHTKNVPDEVIIADMEKAARPHTTREEVRKRYEQAFGKRDRFPG